MASDSSPGQTRQLGTPLLLVTGIAGVGTAVALFHTIGSVLHRTFPAFAGDGIPFEAAFDGALLVAAFVMAVLAVVFAGALLLSGAARLSEWWGGQRAA